MFSLHLISILLIIQSLLCTLQADAQTKEERLQEIKLREAELGLERTKIRMARTKREAEGAQQLFEEGLITLQDRNQEERKYKSAQLAYKQQKIGLERQKLEFLAGVMHISVKEARKYRTPDGRRMVDITLGNSSHIAQAMNLNKDLSRDQVVSLLEIQNIMISLTSGGTGTTKKEEKPKRPEEEQEDEESSRKKAQKKKATSRASASGLIIAEPYEVILPFLKLKEEKTLTFRLLMDVEELGIKMKYLETEKTIPVVLKKEALEDLPMINSAQFSQEGNLNSIVNFDIILERLSEEEKTFRLALLNIPMEIDYSFVDQGTKASLSQVKFTESTTKIQLYLEISIPEKLSREYIDSTLEFFVLVTDREGFEELSKLRAKYKDTIIPETQINTVKASKVKLELLPRGEGAMEVVTTDRYQEIKVGEVVSVRIDIHNTGTLAVFGVTTDVSAPLGWEVEAIPAMIAEVKAGKKEPVNITITPPEDLVIGEYEIRLEALGTVGNIKVESDEKDVTIRVSEKANILKNTLLVLAVIGVIMVVVVTTIRSNRR